MRASLGGGGSRFRSFGGDERVCVGRAEPLRLFVPPLRNCFGSAFPTRSRHRLAHAGTLLRNSRRQRAFIER
jgi:hypothetical protein